MTVHPSSACPLCCFRDSTAPFARDAAREYMICSECDLVFVPPRWHPAPDAEKRRYDLHQNDPSEPGYRRFLSQLADPLKARLPAGAQGLDFGCGPTAALALLLEEAGFRMGRYDPFYAPDSTVLQRVYDFIACSEVVEHFF